MPDNLTIRDAAMPDQPTLVEFNLRMAWETEQKRLPPQTVTQGVARVLAEPGLGRYFVACRGQVVVGQMMLTTEWSDWRNGQMGWIQSVYVVPEERGRGVFRALLEHVRRAAQEKLGYVGLRLYVERHNQTAQQVYQKLGLVDAGYLVMEQMF